MPITQLSTPVPSRSAPPEVFISRMDTLLSELPNFVNELNAFAAALDNITTTSTSSTSLAIGTGNKSLTVDTGKSYQVGMTVKIASNTSPANWMLGEVNSYNSGTGALVVAVSTTQGSGTVAAWTISMASPGGATLGSNNFTGAQNEAQGADIASASTVNLDAATGNLVDVTGVVTITAITLAQGAERVVRFTGACTLTHGASLVLPGGANIITAAGDFASFRGYAAGVVRCTVFTPARGNEAFPATTRMVFAQAAAPAGWTQDASNDQVLRVVSGAGGGSGGTLSITSAVTGGHALTEAENGTHTHTDSGHTHPFGGGVPIAIAGSAIDISGTPNSAAITATGAGTANIQSSGSGTAHGHPLAIKYQDVIICAKN